MLNLSSSQIFDYEKKIMKVVILAGGKGTRLSEFTKLIPKPMIKIVKMFL